MAKKKSKKSEPAQAPTPQEDMGQDTDAQGNEYSVATFTDLKEHADQLKLDHNKRDEMFKEMDYMFLMEDDEVLVTKRENDDDVKKTLSPDARNALLGALRLIIATDPHFSMPLHKNKPRAQRKADPMEKMAGMMMQASSRQRKFPVHYDAILSALLYSEVHIGVTKTEDIVEDLKAQDAPLPIIKAAELLAMRTPYFFEPWSPVGGYPEWDSLGLAFYMRESIQNVGTIMDRYGESNVLEAIGEGAPKRWEKKTLRVIWDRRWSLVYIKESADKPILMEMHELPRIPVVAQLIEGSLLFEKPEQQRQPFLYTLWKSGLWNRQNLSLTVLYTLIFAIGASTPYVHEDAGDEDVKVDWETLGGITKVKKGKLRPLGKDVIDPSIMVGLDIANTKGIESTIYRQALGEPLGGDAPYSTVALLSQSGRLPLIYTQRMGGWGLGEAVEMAYRWMKHDAKESKSAYRGDEVTLKPEDIPDDFEIETTLEISMPQDRLSEATIANSLAGGEDPMVSRRWVLENVIREGSAEDMQKEIWSEKAANLRAMSYFADKLLEVKQKIEQAMAPPMPPQVPGGEMDIDPRMVPPDEEIPGGGRELGPDGRPIMADPAAGVEAGIVSDGMPINPNEQVPQ